MNNRTVITMFEPLRLFEIFIKAHCTTEHCTGDAIRHLYLFIYIVTFLLLLAVADVVRVA